MKCPLCEFCCQTTKYKSHFTWIFTKIYGKTYVKSLGVAGLRKPYYGAPNDSIHHVRDGRGLVTARNFNEHSTRNVTIESVGLYNSKNMGSAFSLISTFVLDNNLNRERRPFNASLKSLYYSTWYLILRIIHSTEVKHESSYFFALIDFITSLCSQPEIGLFTAEYLLIYVMRVSYNYVVSPLFHHLWPSFFLKPLKIFINITTWFSKL